MQERGGLDFLRDGRLGDKSLKGHGPDQRGLGGQSAPTQSVKWLSTNTQGATSYFLSHNACNG